MSMIHRPRDLRWPPLILAVLALLIFNTCAHTPTGEGEDDALNINLPMEKYVLDNGLTVILVEDHHLPIVAYNTLYKVGSAREDDTNNGVSHFLEHMMFKKTRDLADGEFDGFIKEAGGFSNAWTNSDNTNYYERIAAEFLPALIKYEAGRMAALALEENAFETERQVILEERRMRYENSDWGKVLSSAISRFLKNSPYYQRTVIGTPQSIAGLTHEQMLHHYQLYYAPNNAILVIVGDFDSREVLAQIKQAYGPLAAKEIKPLPVLSAIERSSHGDFGKHYQYNGESVDPMFVYLMPGKTERDAGYPAYRMLLSILASGDSSYLKQRYVYAPKPLLRSISVEVDSMEFDGVTILGGVLMPGTNWEKFKRQFPRQMPEFCTAIDQRALEKAKNRYRVYFYDNLETGLDLAMMLASAERTYGDFRKYQEENKAYLQTTLAQVQAACQELFAHPQFTLASIWKKNKNRVLALPLNQAGGQK